MLPDADYVVLGSRIALGLDGGFAVAVPARLRLLEASGAREPLMLSIDGGSPADHAAQRQAFVDGGHVSDAAHVRNLFDELHAGADWLLRAGVPGERTPGVQYRTITVPGASSPVVSLPVFENDPEWHLRDAAVVVHAPDGDRVLAGFGGLYIAWLQHIAAERRAAAGDRDRLLVVVCESRQVGEALVGWDDPRVRIVHTIHNSHLPAPHDDPEAPVTGLWERWLRTIEAYDAVLWPTAAQRDEIAERFGDPGTFHVVPNTIDLGPEPSGGEGRDPHRVVMLNRLAPQKRVDLAIRAWPRVVAAVPDARLDVYGDGPLRDELQALIDELGVAGSTTLHGTTAQRDAVFARASLFLTSTAFEGQGLSIAEALACGLPVVSTDARYGPREAVGDAGVMVPPGDVDALADAVIDVLRDDARRVELAAHARRAAAAFSPEAVQPGFVEALRAAVESPSRRAR